MEKMTPPPNYYGAPYPQNTSPQFQTNPNQYSNSNYQSNQEQSYNNNTTNDQSSNAYDSITESVKNVDHLFEVFKTHISKNIGRRVQVYASFTDSTKWHDVVFDGILVSIADDFMIVKTSDTKYDLISRIYVDYISFYDN